MSEPCSQSQTSMPRPSISGSLATKCDSLVVCALGQHDRNINKSAVCLFNRNPLLTANTSFCPRRGQSPMHVLGHYGKENAAAIFELFLECMPEYPLDKPDNEGNTGTITLFICIAFNTCGTTVCLCLFPDDVMSHLLSDYSSAPGLHEGKCKSVSCHCEGWRSLGRQ